jgi:hypothetical protein
MTSTDKAVWNLKTRPQLLHLICPVNEQLTPILYKYDSWENDGRLNIPIAHPHNWGLNIVLTPQMTRSW